jgi:hypothetical protein
MPQGARLSLKRYFEILMPGLVPGISVFGKVVPVLRSSRFSGASASSAQVAAEPRCAAD